ncbi:MAG: hypothetical protein ACM3TN_11730 [Alphaproteobacteria bacterium]
MALDVTARRRIFGDLAFLLSGWKRELWEWLVAVAAVGVGLSVFRAIARAVFDLAIGLSLFH